VTLYVGLHNRDAKTVLDSASIAVAGAPGWQQVRCRRRRRRLRHRRCCPGPLGHFTKGNAALLRAGPASYALRGSGFARTRQTAQRPAGPPAGRSGSPSAARPGLQMRITAYRARLLAAVA
jgi:hypothetical protein